MAQTITCPMCQSDIALRRDQAIALCDDCHDMTDAELSAELQRRVDRALWTALRAVDDEAAYSRWSKAHDTPGRVDGRDSDEAADLLRKILKRRG